MATKSPPAPPIAPKQQTNQQSNQPPTGQPEEQAEETSYESVRGKLHQALAYIADATNELDALEQQAKGGQ